MEALPLALCAMNIKTTMFWKGINQSLDSSGNYKPNYKFSPVNFLPVKRQIQAFPKNSNSINYGISSQAKIRKDKKIASSSSSSLPPQTTKENWKLPNGKAKVPKLGFMVEPAEGRLLEDGRVFQENFTIKSYQLGSDSKLSIAALMGYLQETALNHHKSVGLVADGFGSSTKMTEMNLIWVICWSKIEVDYYPSWDDVVQVETWKWSRNLSWGSDWRIRDFRTGKILLRATSFYLIMNKKTRKFTKLREEIFDEMRPFFKECDPFFEKDSRRLAKFDVDKADHVRTGLKPGWTDMDVNQHVSHIKLVNYVLESVPCWVVETHKLSSITLEYKRECHCDRVLESLSKVITNNQSSTENQGIEFEHCLRFECGMEIVRGRTKWKPKIANNWKREVQSLAESALNGIDIKSENHLPDL